MCVSAIGPSDLLITGELSRRPPRAPDLQAEIEAFYELSTVLAYQPRHGVQRFVEIACELCRAGSAGFSRIETGADGAAVFRWTALAGRFAPYVGGTTPRDFSPCSLCLDQGRTILLSRPARVFRHFEEVAVPITEALIVPVYDTGRTPLGTIWVISHDDRRFDAADARILEQLAIQLVLAIKAGTEQVRLEQTQLVAQEAGHRVGNSLQMVGSLLAIEARAARSPEAAETLRRAAARVAAVGRVHHRLAVTAAGAQAGCLAYLRSLCEAIAESLASDAPLRLEVEGREAELPAEKLVPVGLIVNELVTNAAKHAGGSRITVRFDRSEDGYSLLVADDGEGMPENFDPKNGAGLGTKIVGSLVAQLGGTMSGGRGPDGRGSRFAITFA